MAIMGFCPGLSLLYNISSDEEFSVKDVAKINEDNAESPLGRMARRLLTAELNLTAGAGSCAVTRELVVAGHALLVNQRYDGSPVDPEALEDSAAEAMGRVSDLLDLYNHGRLCR